eukprot:Amastigsp_a174720_307.p2 type:complete len:161 gc:universal Amastigsp_a174720_307:56-538(+)
MADSLEMSLDAVEASIAALPTSGKARTKGVHAVEATLSEAQSALVVFKAEIRELPQAAQAGAKASAKAAQARIARLRALLLEAQDADELIARAHEVQSASAASLSRSKRIIAETQALGEATTGKLASQADQIRRIDAGLDDVGSSNKAADKQIRALRRRI